LQLEIAIQLVASTFELLITRELFSVFLKESFLLIKIGITPLSHAAWGIRVNIL